MLNLRYFISSVDDFRDSRYNIREPFLKTETELGLLPGYVNVDFKKNNKLHSGAEQ